MKKLLSLIVICFFGLSLAAQTVYPDYADGKIYIRLKKDYRAFMSAKSDLQHLPTSTLPFLKQVESVAGITNLSLPFKMAKKSPELQRTYLLEFSNATAINAIIQQLEASGNIEFAEKVPLVKSTLTVNDPSYSSQWGLATIQAPLAWNFFSSGSNIVVAIVDDAIERTHPDLAPNLWVNPGEISGNGIDDDGNGYVDDVNGWDVADNDNNPNPPTSAFGHGTHVAGIAGAATNNATGVASIGFSVKLMCVKSTNSATSVTHGYDGVLYAAENGADVINMSWGGTGSSVTTQSIIDYAYSLGVVLVAAAGNDNVSTMFYPAAYTNVIAVAATSSGDPKASFSNYGSWVDISAPGNNIYSTTVSATYGNKSGTSMASPMVAGLAGLMLSLNPSLTPADIRTCLTSTADNIDAVNPTYIGQLGAGRINANNAMNCISSTLAWPPSTDFVANVTTVTAGGQVTFTDLTVYSPTTWSWTFTGGTPASSSSATPPSITYNTPGTYTVTLTTSNANGSDTETKTAYITVNPDGGCYQINLPTPGTWTPVNYYTGASVGADGWINGKNIYSDKEKAMYFDASATPYTTLNNIWIAFGLANSSTSSKIVPIKVYDGTSGSPGTLLGTTNLTMGQIMSDVAGGYYTEANFITTPVVLPASKRFFVSVDLTNLSWGGATHDTLSIVSNSNGQTVPSAIWDKNSSNIWQQYNTGTTWALNASLYIHPFLTNTPTNATFTTTATTICEDQSITFNGAGSTYEDTLLWYFPGGSPVISNSLSESVMFNTPGTYTAILYVIGGGCSLLDSAFVNITVNPKPNVSVSTPTPDICTSGSASLSASGATSYTWSPSTGLSATTGASVTASPTSTTTYTVTGTSTGCTNSSTIEIEVKSPPTAAIALGAASVCEGSSVSFDGSSSTFADSFNWALTGGSPASSTATGGTTSYATAGTYNVTLQVTNMCGTNTQNSSVTVNANPTATFTITTDTVCVNDAPVALTGTPTGGVFSGTGVTGSSFDPSTGTGNYTITYMYTDGNGCSDTQTDNLFVDACLGIENFDLNHAYQIYPNPAANTLTIVGNNFNQITLTDMTGRIVLRQMQTTQNISVAHLPNGIYTLTLSNATSPVYTNRLIIAR